MNIDDLKNNWKSLDLADGCRQDADMRELISNVKQGRISTLRDRLCAIRRRMTITCFGCILIMIPYFREATVLAILSILYFIFMGVMHLISYWQIKQINFSLMTVRESIISIGNIMQDQIRKRAIGMALGIPLIIYMLLVFTDIFGEYYIYGCLIGVVIGAVIGLLINRKIVGIIQEMKKQLSED